MKIKRCKQMRNELKAIHLKLTLYGCSTHRFNLLGNDITLSQVVSHVVEIEKYFPNHNVLKP